MARLVRHDRNRPYEVKAKDGETFYICACGLSRNKPFCDGSHKRTQDEAPGELYVYDETSRVKVTGFYPA
ncbi:MAG: CDGSH iron-sulfur domain-containing protein [Thermoprotei archaeon]